MSRQSSCDGLSADTADFKFFLPVRVHYADTDAMQIVYYGAYFNFFESGRQEYWRRLGLKLEELRQKGYFLTIAETACRYFNPAYYDDVLDVYVRTSRMGKRSFDIDYLIIRRKDNKQIAAARTAFVLIDLIDRAPRDIPSWLITAVAQFDGSKPATVSESP